MHPLAVCWWVTWVVADMLYLGVLREVKKTEIILKDGRKVGKRTVTQGHKAS